MMIRIAKNFFCKCLTGSDFCYSWYSWLIQNSVYGVYCFDFLFMIPQLFVNYKLKSVAHLPWKTLMYKVFILRDNLTLIFLSVYDLFWYIQTYIIRHPVINTRIYFSDTWKYLTNLYTRISEYKMLNNIC